MSQKNHIDYIELPAQDINASKTFFTDVFGWEFEDYGEEYTAFSSSGVLGGFYKSELKASVQSGSALVVLYSDSLEETQSEVEAAGGKILIPIFSFPGGRRFQFIEPSGNELAVWSDT